ncbi:MAG: extracellular solute-binding protein [Bacillus sp. (in: Bacteria)]|nr:extracellular solute-binding protein [Bacillus sp. (in: firmicutes)]
MSRASRSLICLALVGMALLGLGCVTLGAGQKIAVAVQAGAPEPAVYKNLSKEFTRQTGIDIEWVEIPQEQQHDKLFMELMSGSSAYDAIALDHPWVPEFASAGFLDPLDELIDTERDDFYKTALQIETYNGKIYAIPQYTVIVIMYYRTDLFNKYHLRIPTLDKPLSWDEFLTAARKLTIDENKDGQPEVYGTIVMGKRHPVPALAFVDWANQAGGGVFDEKGKVIINSRESVKALQFLVDMVHKYKVAPPGAAAFDHVDNHTLFMQGKLGMAINWQYAYSLISDKTNSAVVGKFDICLPPKDKISTSTVGAWGLAIPKTAKNKESARKWIKFITSAEQLYRLRKESLGPAVRKSELALLKQDTTLSKDYMHALEVMSAAAAQGTVVPRIPEWPQVQEYIAEAVSDAIARNKTPKQALDLCAQRIAEYLKNKH